MKNGGRITAADDPDHIGIPERKLYRRDKNGVLVRKDDPEGKYANLRPSRYSNPEGSTVTPMGGKEIQREGGDQCVPGGPGETKLYSGRTLPKPEKVRQIVEDKTAVAKARADAKEKK